MADNMTVATPPEIVAVLPDAASRVDRAVRKAKECDVSINKIASEGVVLAQRFVQIMATNPEPNDPDAAASAEAAIVYFEKVLAIECLKARGPATEMAVGGGIGLAIGGTIGAVAAKKKDRLAYGALAGLGGGVAGALAGWGVHAMRVGKRERPQRVK